MVARLTTRVECQFYCTRSGDRVALYDTVILVFLFRIRCVTDLYEVELTIMFIDRLAQTTTMMKKEKLGCV